MFQFLGQIQLFGFGFEQPDWVKCRGQILQMKEHKALYQLIGTKFGGNGILTFALPDLRDASPTPGMEYYISLKGVYPSRN